MHGAALRSLYRAFLREAGDFLGVYEKSGRKSLYELVRIAEKANATEWTGLQMDTSLAFRTNLALADLADSEEGLRWHLRQYFDSPFRDVEVYLRKPAAVIDGFAFGAGERQAERKEGAGEKGMRGWEEEVDEKKGRGRGTEWGDGAHTRSRLALASSSSAWGERGEGGEEGETGEVENAMGVLRALPANTALYQALLTSLQPKQRPVSLLFDVGDVLVDEKDRWVGVVFGWDVECRMPQPWRNRNNVSPEKAALPFYHLLCGDGVERYASQLTHVLVKPREPPLEKAPEFRLLRRTLSSFFVYFDASLGKYVPNEHLRRKYPPPLVR